MTELLFGAGIMALGWSLRGQFGHLKGALIPGACAAVLLVAVLSKDKVLFNRPWIYILGPIGFSVGGHMGYGKLVESLIQSPEFPSLVSWAQIFFIGALWGGIGAACLAFGMRRPVLSVLDAGVISFVLLIWTLFLGVMNWESYEKYFFSAGFGLFILYGAWIRSRRIVSQWGIAGFFSWGFAFAAAVLLLRLGETGYFGHGWPWWRLRDQWIGAFGGMGLVLLAKLWSFSHQQGEAPILEVNGSRDASSVLRPALLFFFGWIPLLNLVPTFYEWFTDYSLPATGRAGIFVAASAIVTGWLILQVIVQTRKLSGFPKEEAIRTSLVVWIWLLIAAAITKAVWVRGWNAWEDGFTLLLILGVMVSVRIANRRLVD